MSSVNFAIPDFCLRIPHVSKLAGNFLAELASRSSVHVIACAETFATVSGCRCFVNQLPIAVNSRR